MTNLFLRNDGRFIAPFSGDISTSTSTITFALFTSLANSISTAVSLTSTGVYFDGPVITQGTSGIWLASGWVSLGDSNASASTFSAKLWDGTTLISAGASRCTIAAAFPTCGIGLSGVITNPAGNIRISAASNSATSFIYNVNQVGTANASTITAVRIG